jgi:hypothetical protein
MVTLTNAQVTENIDLIYACVDTINTSLMILNKRSLQFGIADKQQLLIDNAIRATEALMKDADSFLGLDYASALGDRNEKFYENAYKFIKKHPVIVTEEHKNVKL